MEQDLKHQDLIMDVSKEIFKLDKDILTFIINPSSISRLSSLSTHSSQYKPLSDIELTVKNLTSDYIVFRAKTTKKTNFTIQPTYSLLNPNSDLKMTIKYYNELGSKLSNYKENKFRFEGFIITEKEKDLDIKGLFNDYTLKKIKVIGNRIKLYGKIIEENMENNNEKEIIRDSNNSLGSNNLSNISGLSNYSISENKEKNEENNNIRLSDLIMNKNENNKDMSNKEKYEILKSQYDQLKNEVDQLKKTEELLNKKIKDVERNKIIGNTEYEKFKMPEIKEKPLSKNILLSIFAFSLLLGFILIK